MQVNETLTLDFHDADAFESHHYAFHVDEDTFDAHFARLEAESVVYGNGNGNGPGSSENGQINHRGGGKGVYFKDPDGHLLELLTVA